MEETPLLLLETPEELSMQSISLLLCGFESQVQLGDFICKIRMDISVSFKVSLCGLPAPAV